MTENLLAEQNRLVQAYAIPAIKPANSEDIIAYLRVLLKLLKLQI